MEQHQPHLQTEAGRHQLHVRTNYFVIYEPAGLLFVEKNLGI